MVYFIQAEAGGPVKIGTTTRSPQRRLADLQVGCPVQLVIRATIPGGSAVEREWHQRFASQRLHGEWFSPSKGLEDAIDVCLVGGSALGPSPAAVMPFDGATRIPHGPLLERYQAILDVMGPSWRSMADVRHEHPLLRAAANCQPTIWAKHLVRDGRLEGRHVVPACGAGVIQFRSA